jgi:hypothetical protein
MRKSISAIIVMSWHMQMLVQREMGEVKEVALI